jgi:hypothetical protein
VRADDLEVGFQSLQLHFILQAFSRQIRTLILLQKQHDVPKGHRLKDLSDIVHKRQHPWTHVHSHYAMMGGFALDPSWSSEPFFPGPRVRMNGEGLGTWDELLTNSQPSSEKKILNQSLLFRMLRHCSTPEWPKRGANDTRTQQDPPEYNRLTLTDSGVLFLATYCPEALPDLSCEQINDQSKANGLTKSLICLQALWFCVQCITRLAFQLSISLLELNTCGHSICALLLAFLWWHKPQDVEEPTVIPVRNENMEELCAFMCMDSVLDDQRELDLFRDFHRRKKIPYKSPAPFKPMRYPLRDLEEIFEKCQTAEQAYRSSPSTEEHNHIQVPSTIQLSR